MRGWALVVTLWCWAASIASAQSDDWLILPVSIGDEDTGWMPETVRQVRRELRAQGIGAWSAKAATARITARGPFAPSAVSDQDYEAWRSAATETVRALAGGDYESVLPALEEAQAFSRANSETLNRDPTRAQAVLDTCLYLVRALAGTGDLQAAGLQTQECVRLSPGLEPTSLMHPPIVTELHKRAAASNRTRSGTLTVESLPPGCTVRRNGFAVGTTPLETRELYPGSYRIQVECDGSEPGSVHVVDVPVGERTLFVIDDFDRAVGLSPVLHLEYESDPDAQRVVRDARELARALPASSVVLANRVDPSGIELRMIEGTEMRANWVRVSAPSTGVSGVGLATAVAGLLRGECGDFREDGVLMMDCTTGAPVVVEPEAGSPRPPRGQFVAGLTLGSIGAASLLSSYGLLIARRNAGEDWLASPQSVSAQNKWLRLGDSLLVTGPAGAGLLVASMPLVLPYRDETPWWSWMTGAVGVASVGAAVALAVTADSKRDVSCRESGPDPAPCVGRERRTDLALLLGVTAAPLITVPLVYLFRRPSDDGGARLVPSVRAGRNGGQLSLSGAF